MLRVAVFQPEDARSDVRWHMLDVGRVHGLCSACRHEDLDGVIAVAVGALVERTFRAVRAHDHHSIRKRDLPPAGAGLVTLEDDFRIVRDNLAGGNRSTRDRLVPYCMFTDPPLARVGLSESEAERQGVIARVARLPMDSVLGAQATDHRQGFMKALVADSDDRILGFTMIGAAAGEVMAAVHTAMLAGLSYPSLANAALAHPTMAEGLSSLFSACHFAAWNRPNRRQLSDVKSASSLPAFANVRFWPLATIRCSAMTCRFRGKADSRVLVYPGEFMSSRP
jgi:Pyridine nucleotide-disulphide oxidoreductase, dimerisation domain